MTHLSAFLALEILQDIPYSPHLIEVKTFQIIILNIVMRLVQINVCYDAGPVLLCST